MLPRASIAMTRYSDIAIFRLRVTVAAGQTLDRNG
jgi:hypothetical protein